MDATTLLLFSVAFAVGAVNVVVGPTGGVMAGAVAAVVPPPASLLLHAGVSWWSALWRSTVLWRDIRWALLLRLAAASSPALGCAIVFGAQVSSDAWRLAIAAWLGLWALSARFRSALSKKGSQTAAAVAAGVASGVIGAGGVVVMPTIRSATNSLDEAIATEAALTVVQNTVKVLLLVLLLHVSLEQYVLHAVVMAVGASLGLVLGRRVRVRLSERTRERLLTATLLGVACWLVQSALL